MKLTIPFSFLLILLTAFMGKRSHTEWTTNRANPGIESDPFVCNCLFAENGNTHNKYWYNVMCSGGDDTINFSLVVKEIDTENKIIEYFDFEGENGDAAHYRWLSSDISEFLNNEGKLKSNFKRDNYELGFTTSDELAMKWMLGDLFPDCDEIRHDY